MGHDYERPWGEMDEIRELQHKLKHEYEVSGWWRQQAQDVWQELTEAKDGWHDLVSQLERTTEQLARAEEEAAAFRQRTKELQKENENLRVKVAEFDRYREYTQAGFKTLYYERRHGPAIGAPGTEKLKRVDSTDGRVVVYPRPPAEEPPGWKGVPFVVDGLDFSDLYRDGRDL
jgi:hypothetical protein